jgi:L-lactate dehydrogenase
MSNTAPKQFNSLFLKVRNAPHEIIKRKGHTNYAVALGLAKIVESILQDENAVLTVSCLLEDHYGVSDICLSVPVILGRTGSKEIIRLPLEEKEIADFKKSAAIVKKVADSLGL